jgi:hypothetical protein
VNLKDRYKDGIIGKLLPLSVFVLSILSIDYARLNLYRRYTNNIDSSSIVRYQVGQIGAFIEDNKFQKSSKFLVVGDKTQNGSLVFLNRFGWNYPDFKFDFGNLKNNLAIADYLLILKPSENRIPDDLRTKLIHCTRYSYNSNFIFDLKNYGK